MCRDHAPPSDADVGLHALFFDRFWMAFVARDNIHFITFDLAFEDERMLVIGNPSAKLHGHFVSLRDRQTQFRGDLLIRQIESHKVRTQHPNPQRPMVPCENRHRQIIKTTIALMAEIPLAADFGCIVSVLDDLLAFTVRTADALGPA
jgi:hypothetical protein